MDRRREEIEARFGASASEYATSESHAGGPDLDRMLDLVAPRGHEIMLDVATGAGNTALAFASRVRRVVALDLAQGMIDKTRERFEEAGYTNGEFVVHDVETLPFEDSAFDVVTSRIAPHHFVHVDRGVREMARVLKSGGRLLIVDSMSPDDASLAAFLHEAEAMRDPTHVRSLSRAEWVALFEAAGLRVETVEIFRKRHAFEPWVARGGTTAEAMAAVRERFKHAPESAKALFEIHVAGDEVVSFTDEKVLVAGRK